MLADAIIKNDEMIIINFPRAVFYGKHWKVNIEPIEEIKEDDAGVFDEFVGVLDGNFITNDLRYSEIVK